MQQGRRENGRARQHANSTLFAVIFLALFYKGLIHGKFIKRILDRQPDNRLGLCLLNLNRQKKKTTIV